MDVKESNDCMNVEGFNECNLNAAVICKQLLKHSIYNAVFVLNTDGYIMGISKGVKSSYGYAEEDVCGKYFDLLFKEEDRLKHKPEIEIATVLQHGTASDYNDIVHKDGRFIWTEGEAVLINDAEGHTFIIKNVHSLEKQKNLERDLKDRNEKLMRVNNDLDTFVYTASHDLKNPVTNIESLISIVKDELKQGATATSMEPVISLITEALKRFKTTLNELTVIGTIDPKTNADEPYIDFDALLQEVMYDVQDTVNRTDASVQADFSAAPGVHFSKKNLRSVLFNLLSNALKYRSQGRLPKIRIYSTTENEYVLLTVSDNGIGIDTANHKQVFEFFKRAHTHVEGTGVGMGIVKKIMDNAEGKITLDSTPGEGSTFTVYFKQ